jgi:phosphatidylserine/phosphatidylglycerophosphate/cardiolipin synthase-like enzyme
VLEYFPAPTVECPTFTGDSEWHPLVDGAAYLGELSAQLDGLGPGDGVLIAGFSFDPEVDLDGRSPGEPGYRALGERLACAAAQGTTVRVMLAGRVLASSVPSSFVGGFRANAGHAERLRAWRPAGVPGDPPLHDAVLLDFAGAVLGSNHQKYSVVRKQGVITAFVGGIDLVARSYDAVPHDRLRHRGRRWGWHDCQVRLRGPAAAHVWDVFAGRWQEAATLPPRRYLSAGRLRRLNPPDTAPTPPPAVPQPALDAPHTAVRVLRSVHERKFGSIFPWRRLAWQALPPAGVHEVFGTVTAALNAARRYIYLEDQYLSESPGGDARYELYPYLRAAAARGVKVILVGSGIRDPDDPGWFHGPINRVVNDDVLTKVIEPLDAACRSNVVMYRVDDLTVHAKLVLIDDTFASIGSANMFSRSMVGTDNELCAAIVTSTAVVRDLRVQLWLEHLRADPSAQVLAALEDLELALGIFDPSWLSEGADPNTWRAAGTPAGFAQQESVWTRIPLPRR